MRGFPVPRRPLDASTRPSRRVDDPPVAQLPVPVSGNGAAKKEDDKPLPPPVLPQRIDPLA